MTIYYIYDLSVTINDSLKLYVPNLLSFKSFNLDIEAYIQNKMKRIQQINNRHYIDTYYSVIYRYNNMIHAAKP